MYLVDDCVYHRFKESKYIFLILYVDDILLATNDIDILHETKKFLSKNFEMKDLSDTSFVLGIQIHQDRSQGILGLSQRSYIKKILKRFGMYECKSGDTPVAKGDMFSIRQCPKGNLEIEEMQKIPYASTVRSLMYAQVCTRPNIAYIWGSRQIFKQSRDEPLESIQKSHEIFKENKRLHAHIQEVRLVGDR